jgi:hypothetical protein
MADLLSIRIFITSGLLAERISSVVAANVVAVPVVNVDRATSPSVVGSSSSDSRSTMVRLPLSSEVVLPPAPEPVPPSVSSVFGMPSPSSSGAGGVPPSVSSSSVAQSGVLSTSVMLQLLPTPDPMPAVLIDSPPPHAASDKADETSNKEESKRMTTTQK